MSLRLSRAAARGFKSWLGRSGNVDFGPKVGSYDERFENILVTYDGTDAATLERVKAAVNTLRR
jgi:hypothetical protein